MQWSVFLIGPGSGRGESPGADTPVLVVSRESANQALPVVTVLPLVARRKGRRIYPNETILPAEVTDLEAPAVLMAHQITTVAKERLSTRMGMVQDPELRSSVQNAVRVQLDLEHDPGASISNPRRLESDR